MPSQTISQEAFNQAVKENIDEFDMEPEDAVRSAVDEFKLQGVDLAGLVLTADAESTRHPAEVAAEAVLQSAASGTPSPEELNALRQSIQGIDAKAQDMAATVAQKAGVVPTLLRTSTASSDSATSQQQIAALDALAAVCTCSQARDQLAAAQSCSQLCQLMAAAGSTALAEALARALGAAVLKNELNKVATVDAGLSEAVQGVLSLPGVPGSAVVAVCELLRRCCNADDERPVVSRAFQNGRTMGGQGVPQALLKQLKTYAHTPLPDAQQARDQPSSSGQAAESADANEGDDETVSGTSGSKTSTAAVQTAVCSALKWLVVNEEICKTFAEDGGIQTALQVLQQGLGKPGVVRTSAALLRQLAGSDAIKAEIIELGALDVITRAARLHLAHLGALEQVLGLLAALTLRNPEGGEAAVEAGCVDATLQVMGATMSRMPAAQWVQRQACQAIRNIAGRCPELRPAVKERGAEALLRTCGDSFPKACRDVSSAALRDLGFDDYVR